MDANELRRRLADPFPADVVGWKAQSVKNNRALAVGFIDARDVMDRLDDVFGVDGWQDSYMPLGDGVLCTLRIKVGDAWVEKQDVGSPSEQPDAGDRNKAAVSDALKRAAVKLGIGRYLYSLPKVWADYDPVKKQLSQTPSLPAWALPGGSGRPGAQPRPNNSRPSGDTKPDPAALYELLKSDLGSAISEAALKEAFGRAYKASEAGHIGKDAFGVLTRLKDERKASFSKFNAAT